MISKREGLSSRAVAIWLLAGVGMIMGQVILGGITRLTGSGLSITEWKPILGALPPMNEVDWQHAFDQYKQIGQYKLINSNFTLSEFKFIYFWEWLHRIWARLMGLVFVIPFGIFIYQKRFKADMIYPLLILFLLGGLQGAIGWIMVKSGLNEENVYVSHIRLAVHFIAALGLLLYTFWFALRILVPADRKINEPFLKKMLMGIFFLLVLQLIYGAFMAGLKAATMAPTWPTINGSWLPNGGEPVSGLRQFTDNPLMVHFIHRVLAYLLFIGVFWWWALARTRTLIPIWRHFRDFLPLIVSLQLVLGIFTVIYSPDPRFLLWLGVAHQFTAMLLLLAIVGMLYGLTARGNN